LAISDSIIKYHNGLISVESIVDSGTAFTIYLAAKLTNGT
jgi:signal transduction histidine kinase